MGVKIGDTTRTTREWAEELGCHPETIRRAIRAKELLAEIDPLSKGPTYRMTSKSIARWLEDRRTR